MAEAIATYDVEVSGLWRTVHRLRNAEGEVGVLEISRGRGGLIVAGRYSPVKGEVLQIRRDPGLLRSQFSIWTDGQEWLGSSLRWSFVRREIVLHTGSRPLRILPQPGFRMGWTLQAPRTGEMARIRPGLLSRRSRIEVFRKVEFELLLFTYFLGWQIRLESFWPGPLIDEEPSTVAAPKTPAKSSGS
jgi:hypothetical protein